MKKINARAHWEKRKGTHVQAKAYCSKEETRVEGPWERGEEPQQGNEAHAHECGDEHHLHVQARCTHSGPAP